MRALDSACCSSCSHCAAVIEAFGFSRHTGVAGLLHGHMLVADVSIYKPVEAQRQSARTKITIDAKLPVEVPFEIPFEVPSSAPAAKQGQRLVPQRFAVALQSQPWKQSRSRSHNGVVGLMGHWPTAAG